MGRLSYKQIMAVQLGKGDLLCIVRGLILERIRESFCWEWCAVSDQKTSKFSVSHWEESMIGHGSVNGVY
jgi:hypothetical protein